MLQTTVTIIMQNHMNINGAKLKKKPEKAPPASVEGVTESMNALVINACYSQHNGISENTEYSAELSEETQSLKRKNKDYVLIDSSNCSQSSWNWFLKTYSWLKS